MTSFGEPRDTKWVKGKKEDTPWNWDLNWKALIAKEKREREGLMAERASAAEELARALAAGEDPGPGGPLSFRQYNPSRAPKAVNVALARRHFSPSGSLVLEAGASLPVVPGAMKFAGGADPGGSLTGAVWDEDQAAAYVAAVRAKRPDASYEPSHIVTMVNGVPKFPKVLTAAEFFHVEAQRKGTPYWRRAKPHPDKASGGAGDAFFTHGARPQMLRASQSSILSTKKKPKKYDRYGSFSSSMGTSSSASALGPEGAAAAAAGGGVATGAQRVKAARTLSAPDLERIRLAQKLSKAARRRHVMEVKVERMRTTIANERKHQEMSGGRLQLH